jgi:tRNA pseudouridine13 synthase
VRGVEPDGAQRARTILAHLAAAPGAPNWYGEQRFGRDGDNAERGLAIVRGETKPPRDRKLSRLLVSSLQSELFNQWLVARMSDGLYARVIAGDVLHKTGGGMFVCTEPMIDEPRLLTGDLVITGPMFGVSMRGAGEGTPAATREDAILAAAGLSREAFSTVKAIAEGTRRDASITVGDPTVRDIGPGAIEVGFSLPGGAYATAVMRELMKADGGPRGP